MKNALRPTSIETKALVRLGDKANAEHREAMKEGHAALQHAIECGRLLTEAKAGMKHGEWLPWLETHFEADPRTARRYLLLHKERELLTNRTRVSDLAIRGGLKLLAEAKRAAKETGREDRRQANQKKIDETEDIFAVGAVFSTIVIDPPWDWGDEDDVDQLGRARPTYQTIPFAELQAKPVAGLADKDCHLYLWITNRSLPKGFALLDAWGFRYITCLTWCKPSFGMGNYFRGQTEHVLFGVKGSQPLKRKNVGTWFAAQRGEGGHSSKPSEFYALVESCSPGPYLELFGRAPRTGWSVRGAEV